MERKRSTSSVNSQGEQPIPGMANGDAQGMSVAQIQRLVRLLDNSDVSELELKRASEGLHLVLRKLKAPDGAVLSTEIAQTASSSNGAATAGEAPGSSPNQHKVVAPLVGVFHPWLKPRGGVLITVGESVKTGQLLGTIESLNVLNEVESAVAGRVVEIHVQDGQPVEYGQVLVTIDSSEAEED